ncbi:IS66 family transposase [Buttiauxella sp. JUb87]|uniref:IS66 family transposase n=1 Tax=Buttiauxella sp. JUb87 TaxID=2485129 RepID=UPI00105F2498|nr:IS66 family transposase [Buttiauxella sp. JUb87]
MNDELPDDINLLKSLLREQRAQNQHLSGLVTSYRLDIDKLKAHIDKLQRMVFGSRSEKTRDKATKLLRKVEKRLTALQAEMGVVLGPDPDPAVPRVLQQSARRKPLPAHLPRETQRIEPEETCCPDCGGTLKPLAESISEQLELISSAFKVIETVRPKLACGRCDHIAQAPMPPKPIDRSYAGAGVLSHILVAKYADHIPLHRQSVIYARQGVELSRSTLERWVDAMADKLRPLYDELNRYVLQPGKVSTDDTTVNLLAPGNGKCKTSRVWVYVRDDRRAGSQMPPAAWFAWSADRKGIHPQAHLAEYSGVLQADAYAGYNALYANGQVTEAGCMAHARRKFHDVHVRTPTAVTVEALRRFGELYAIEAEIRGSPAAERLAVRREKSVPLMASLNIWWREQAAVMSSASGLREAFTYLKNNWNALNEFCRNGWVEIDNNLAENALRMVAVGRRNYLFVGSASGGENAAIMYTLIVTCRLNGVDPEAYLRYVISEISEWSSKRLRDLLPWNIKLPSVKNGL